MYVLRILVALLVMGPASTYASDAVVEGDGSRPAIDVVEATIRTHAVVGFSWIDQPLHKIVLIKTRKDLCAIKYLSFSRGHDQRSPTLFDSGDESYYGEAELYSNSTHTVHRLRLSQLSTKGFATLIVFGSGRHQFFCGGEPFGWGYPTATILSPGSDASLASTQLEDFSKVDFQDPHLQWFRYEEGRKIVIR